MNQAATVEILIQIRDELAGLNRTRAGIKETKKDAESLGAVLKQGFGIGTGIEVARRGLQLLQQSFEEAVVDAFRLANEVRDQSEALRMSAEAYQVLRYEAAQAGVETARLSMAIASQTQSIADARSGVGAFAEAYKALGLNAAQVEQLKPEERLVAVARAVESSTDKTRAFQAAGQILGQRGLPQLLNALHDLAVDGWDKVATAAARAGQVMSEDTVQRLDAAQKRIERFKNSVTIEVGEGLAAVDMIGQSAKKSPFETAWALLKAGMFGGSGIGDLAGVVAKNIPTPPKETPPSSGPAFAREELVLTTRAGAVETKAQQIQSASLLNESEKRRALLPILREQEGIYQRLIDLKFGDTAKNLPVDGKVTEEELAKYRERNELEAKLVAIRQQRMENVDTPLAALGRQLADTTTYAQQALAGGISTALDNLSTDLVDAGRGVKSLGDAFNNLKTTAINTLAQIITRMLLIQAINAGLGIFGYSLNGNASGIVKVGETQVKAAGGGTFYTNGPMNFTVGDNPGGIERVDVTPISGVGRTTVNGQAARMAGGGSAIVGRGGLGREVTVVQNLNVATGVQGTVRAEMVAMMPMFRELATDSVREALARGDL